MLTRKINHQSLQCGTKDGHISKYYNELELEEYTKSCESPDGGDAHQTGLAGDV